LVPNFKAKEFQVASKEPGLDRYRDWLPVKQRMPGAGCTATYFSKQLAATTGLKNLWVAFNGYWPEHRARLLTGTFKELEASCVVGRLPEGNEKIMVVASAGNTAAAFARICSLHGVRCLIIIPEQALGQMRFEIRMAPCIKLVVVRGGGDYSDAIQLSNRVADLPGFFPEGGAKNVARRAGLGSVLLNAFETMGSLPEYYFQAVGSGTGAIAVHEYARRLAGSSGQVPHLWLSQNLPFAPVYDAWKSGKRAWPSVPECEAKHQIGQISAQVLANRFPPYSLRGGLYDALAESDGDMIAVTNEQAKQAARLFEASEGIDIEPAAAVAFASLLVSVEKRRVPVDAKVLLNVTGGGRRRRLADSPQVQMEPDLSLDVTEINTTHILRVIAELYDLPVAI